MFKPYAAEEAETVIARSEARRRSLLQYLVS